MRFRRNQARRSELGGIRGFAAASRRRRGTRMPWAVESLEDRRLLSGAAPIAVNDSYTTPQDTMLIVNAPGVVSNDFDPEFDLLAAYLVTGAIHGFVTFNVDGSFTYNPNAGYNGPDSFTYKLNDGTSDSTPATVSITVTAANTAPVANDDNYTTLEDTPLVIAAPGVLGNDTDAEADPLTALIITAPTHGSLVMAPDGSFTYTPNADYNGPDSFTYQAGDGTDVSNIATVNLTITAVNDAPVATDDNYTTLEDTPLTISAPGLLGNDTDAESDPLTAQLITGPTHGSLGMAPDGSFTYTPNADYNGPDSFTYQAGDGTDLSNIATVNLTITAVNDAPVATDDNYTTLEDTPLVIAAPGVLGNDTDAEAAPLTALIITAPTHGSLAMAPDGSFTYTPNPNYNGPDSFTYKAGDGDGESNIATVNLTITAVNDAPVATDDNYTTLEDTPLVIAAPGVLGNDTDAEADPLTALIITAPTHGSLAMAPDGSFTYTPNANYNGPDSFTYKAGDGDGESNIATVNLIVVAVNDLPVTNEDNYTTLEDTPLVVAAPGILGNDTDVEADPLTAILVTAPTHGSLILSAAGSFTYTPNTNYNGPDSFTYKTNDGDGDGNTATVNLTITAVNDLPVTNDDSYITLEDTPLVVATPGILGNDSDADADPLNAILVTAPTHGSLVLNDDGSFTYTPNTNYNGSDSFTYKTNDGTSDGNTATVNLTITAVNDAPAATDDNYTTLEDTPLTISAPGVLGNDTDAEADPLAAILVNGPSHGSLVFNADGSFTYTPDTNYNGADNFTYNVSDGSDLSNIATVNLTITAVNDAPVATDDSYTTTENTSLIVSAPGVLGNDTDVDGDPLNAVLVTNVAHGTLSLNPNGSFVYVPDSDYSGPDSFTYKASDLLVSSATVTVSLVVNAVNDLPVANDDSYTTLEDTPLAISAPGVLGNDTDAEADPLTALIITAPTHGSLVFNADGSFNYTPNANYNGADSFTYKANDGAADGNVATVTIIITAVNDAPTATDDSYTTLEDTPLTLTGAAGVLANDSDPDSGTLTAALVTGPTHGALVLNADGSLTYTPDANYFGVDSFTYQASDGTLTSGVATATILISPVNDAPTGADDTYSAVEDTPLVVAAPGVLGNDTDPESDPLTTVLVNGPLHGSVALAPDGSFTYTPDANYNGPDNFTYRASDGSLLGNVVTASINVAATIDQPVVTAASLTTVQGAALENVGVAFFTDPDNLPASSYTATVNFNDGTPSVVGTIVAEGNGYRVRASHTFASAGTFPMFVTVTKPDVADTTGVGSVTVSPLVVPFAAELANPSTPSPAGDVQISATGTPTFHGTAPAGSIIQIFVRPISPVTPSGVRTAQAPGSILVATGAAISDGTYSLTLPSSLADGYYQVDAVASTTQGVEFATTTVGTVLIDTHGARVSDIRLDARRGRLIITYDDLLSTGTGSGLSETAIADAANYAIERMVKPPGARSPVVRITGVEMLGPNQVALVLARGRRINHARLITTIRDTLTDRAGNALDGEFTGSVPSGDGVSGGTFLTRIDRANGRTRPPKVVHPHLSVRSQAHPRGPAELFHARRHRGR